MTDQERTANVNAPYLGMNLESDPSSFEQGEFSFVLNAVMNDGFGDNPHVSNAPANEVAVVYPAGYHLLGGERIDQQRRVVMLCNPATGDSQIGITTDKSYTIIVEDNRLNFRMDSQIQIKVKVAFNGDVYAYWVDFHNPIRVMNLTNPPMINGVLDIDQLKLFKNYDVPELEITELMNVGRLVSGGYFILMQYADAKGNGLTAWHRMSNKIAIIRDSISDAYENITGCASNLPTNKAIKVALRNSDLSFTHINIGAIRVIDGAPAGYRVATIPVAQTEYIYTGANTEVPVPIADLIIPPTVYDCGKTLEESDGSLIIGNVKGKKKYNLQPYISQVQVQWQAYRTLQNNRERSHKNPVFAANFMSYRRDEVVVPAVVIEWNDGTETEALPLIGRAANLKSNGMLFTQQADRFGNALNPAQWDTQIIALNDDIYENTSLPRWKVYNTATMEGNKGVGALEGLSFYGECAYWESTDRYPDNVQVWGDLAGQPLRFPKMPDHGILPLTGTENNEAFVYHLGLVFPNIDEVMNRLPDEVKGQMKGWRLVRANRQFNKSVLGSGLLYNCLEQDFSDRFSPSTDLRIYPNYPLNDLRKDEYIMDRDGKPNTRYHKDMFTFLSPDTSLQRAALVNGELKVEGEYVGLANCYNLKASPFPKLSKNASMAIQGIALGEYTTLKEARYGQTRRKLKEAMYIPMDSFVSGGNARRRFWNRGRESTVFLAIDKELADPSVEDRSRFMINNNDQPPLDEAMQVSFMDVLGIMLMPTNISNQVNRPISSYYVSIKQNLPNQYGGIYNLSFVETGYTAAMYARTGVCMGGDTYIGRYADKRQMPFYNGLQDWMDKSDDDGMDLIGNQLIKGTKYGYRDGKGNLMDVSGSHFLCLFMHGVPTFYTESDVNIELRLEGDQAAEATYPSLLNGGLPVEEWLGIKNLDKDNYHENNIDLSGYNDLRYIANTDPLYEPDKTDTTHYYSRAIKSLRSQPEDLYDNWQVFKPLDYYDFPKSKGQLWDIRYVGQARTLFRFERAIQIASLQQTLAASEGQILLGSGRLFAQDPQELLHTEIGYGGTQSQWAFNVTQFGAFFADSANGKVFNFADGLQEISANKAAPWFQRHLPFRLSADIEGIPTDNPANPNGIGLLSTFDPKHNLWILTKKDYEVLDKALLPQLQYVDGRILLGGSPVSLKDPDVFINRSWSLAYSPLTKRWFTFYSFVPDFYLPDNDTVLSVTADSGTATLYRHDSKDRLLTFYGKQVPFVVETVQKQDGASTYISNTQSFITRSLQIVNGDLRPVQNRNFNKAIVYNAHQCTGLLNLKIQDENNLYLLRRGLKNYADSKDIALRLRNNRWNFSDYFDIAKSNAFFTQNWNHLAFREGFFIDKVLNPDELDYTYPWKQAAMMRGLWTKTRLILDDATDLKLLFQVAIENTRPSYL